MKTSINLALRCLVVYAMFTASLSLKAQNHPISIIQQLPAVVTAGDEFDVTFKINKSNVQSFARLQQTLPAGFTAKLKNGKDYHAFVNGNKAKMVWVSLPNSKEFSVTYHIKVSSRLSGEYTLGGEFNYVVNNKKEFAVVEPATIKVLPNATASADDEEYDSMPVGGSTAYDENIFDN